MVEHGHAPARLLVADDNKVNRLLLTRSLELQGLAAATPAALAALEAQYDAAAAELKALRDA